MSENSDFLRGLAKQWRSAQEKSPPALHVHRKRFLLEHWTVLADPGYFPDPRNLCVWELEQSFVEWENKPPIRGCHVLIWNPPVNPGDVGRVAYMPDLTVEAYSSGANKVFRGAAPLFLGALKELTKAAEWLEDLMWDKLSGKPD